MTVARVLIVDDSLAIRRLLKAVLDADPGFEVAGEAPNGLVALSMIEKDRPDAVVLDITMPELDGLETLSRIRRNDRSLPVIMFSDASRRGAEATLDALMRGANCYVPKSASRPGECDTVERLQRELLPKIKALVHGGFAEKAADAGAIPGTSSSARSGRGRIRAIVLASSTGGPPAVQRVLSDLPAEVQLPVFIAQHMPPVFTGTFADRLSATTGRRVQEGVERASVGSGQVWVAPGGYHMTIARQGARAVIALNQGEKVHSCRPAADVLFRSAVEVYGGEVLGIVLTGMGCDGADGCQLIRDAGGQVIVQDEASSAVWGMPGAVAKRGLADEILPVDRIGRAVGARVAATQAELAVATK